MSDTRITSKGQITIPKHVRDRRGITAGTEFEVVERGEEIVLRVARREETKDVQEDKEFTEYLGRARGSMDLGMSSDEFMRVLRGE